MTKRLILVITEELVLITVITATKLTLDRIVWRKKTKTKKTTNKLVQVNSHRSIFYY